MVAVCFGALFVVCDGEVGGVFCELGVAVPVACVSSSGRVSAV